MSERNGLEIAIIGMAGRFPKARSVEELWQNLKNGVDGIRFFTVEEITAQGVPRSIAERPSYVRAGGVVDDELFFDARFFDVTPAEAELLDPQHRLFLECCWTALENAGYSPDQGSIGVWGGAGATTPRLHELYRTATDRRFDYMQTKVSSDGDFLATRVCYKLDLQGPGVTVQTACSTSLVAIHLACQGLHSGACNIALAGGSTILLPQTRGYLHQPEYIYSADGHTRSFDHRASGTMFANGTAVVALRRLEDAERDGDNVLAVIKGSAINNDGASKVGFTAPSVEGQARVIRAAQLMAGVEPETISYLEAHGTGTAMGDPIEIAALTRAFRARTDKRGFCALGSVKSSIGHLDSAAGAAGVIKTTLQLLHRQVPPLLHFERPNPKIDFETSPFFVNTELREWRSNGGPLRAGVSSFGMGGTNAHAVLEEAPPRRVSGVGRSWELLVLSAKTPTALDAMSDRLAAHLESHPELPLADVASTLQSGRRRMSHRRIAVVSDLADAVQVLSARDPARLLSAADEGGEREVVFLFPGQGAQYPGMGRELYDTEPAFRRTFDDCAQGLLPHLGRDLRQVLYADGDAAAAELEQTALTQPALFAFELALARLVGEWGLRPRAMIGHSIGEYVAAHLAGVLELGDALALVAARGRLMQSLPPGAMLSVPLGEAEVVPLLGGDLALAAINAPALCTVSGPLDAIAALAEQLEARGVRPRHLRTSHAFHSAMMDPILDAFAAEVAKVKLGTPSIPYVSTLTGTWIGEHETRDPRYWVRHLRQPVRFAQGAAELLRKPRQAFLEVGPGRTLTTFLQQSAPAGQRVVAQPCVRHPQDKLSDVRVLATTLGKLWLEGVAVDWRGFRRHQVRNRLSLPTYPFERKRFWISETVTLSAAPGAPRPPAGKRADPAEWFYAPSWLRAARAAGALPADERWLLFADTRGIARALAAKLGEAGRRVTLVELGEGFERLDADRFALAPDQPEPYRQLLTQLRQADAVPTAIVHLWGLEPPGTPEELEARSFWSLVSLARALGERELGEPVRLLIASHGLHEVTGGETMAPELALALGPCRVIPQEYPKIACRSLDLEPADPDALAHRLLAEMDAALFADPTQTVAAWRGSHRWAQTFAPLPLPEVSIASTQSTALPALGGLRERGVYLITGGLGGIGAVIAERLARALGARLVLTGRTPLPPREDWASWLASHGTNDATSRRIGRLQTLEALGAEVAVLAADVTRKTDVLAAIAAAHERFGALHGVIHSAGIPAVGLMGQKSPDAMRAVLAPKVTGTRFLGDALAEEELDFFVICSSLASASGGLGQVDYAAANAFEDAYAQAWSRATGRRAVAIGWDAWAEVGMAAEMATRGDHRAATAIASVRSFDHPLLDRLLVEEAEREVYAGALSVERCWVLAEHLIQGRNLLPGTTYLELARAAFEHHRGEGEIELSGIAFAVPFVAPEQGQRELRLELVRDAERYRFTVTSHSEGTAAIIEHAQGWIRSLPPRTLPRRDLASLRSSCTLGEFVVTPQTPLRHGPRWRSLDKILLGEHQMLGEIELPEAFAAELGSWALHPALLDVATSFFARQGSEYLPLAYKRLRLRSPLPRKLYSWVRHDPAQQWGQPVLSFDIEILDEHGELIAEIEKFSIRRVDDAQDRLDTLAVAAQPSHPAGAPAAPPGLGPELEHALSPAEGVDAFARILVHAPASHVLVSTRDLAAVLERARAANLDKLAAQPAAPVVERRNARPEVRTEYVEPRDATERILAALWAELLGIDRLGVFDDFFELGGHSLLGIQLTSRLRDELGVEISVAELFEQPTVAQLAPVIATQISTQTPRKPAIERRLLDRLDTAAVSELAEAEVDALLAEMLQTEARPQ